MWVWERCLQFPKGLKREASLALTPCLHVCYLFTPDFIDSAGKSAPQVWYLNAGQGGDGRKWIKEFPPLRPVAWDANYFFFFVFRGSDLPPCR